MCSFDTFTLRQNNEAKSRKVRRCHWCSETIEIGEVHMYHVGKFEGDFGTMRMHLECLAVYNTVPHEHLCDGIDYGEYKRGVWEQR